MIVAALRRDIHTEKVSPLWSSGISSLSTPVFSVLLLSLSLYIHIRAKEDVWCSCDEELFRDLDMRKYEPKYRWKISKEQLETLGFIHKFRFITSDILAEIFKKDRSTVYERLAVLEQQGYVLKQYDSSFRIRQRAATYCLAPAGIRALKDHPAIEQISLRQNYKNKSFTEEQIDDCLQLAHIHLVLKRHYPGRFGSYTKYQVNRENFVRPTPLLSLQDEREDAPDYILDLVPAYTPTRIIRQRVRQHQAFAAESEYTYPHVLFIAGNDNSERRIAKLTAELYDDFEVYTTTLDGALRTNSRDIWLDPGETLGDDAYDNLHRIELPSNFET